MDATSKTIPQRLANLQDRMSQAITVPRFLGEVSAKAEEFLFRQQEMSGIVFEKVDPGGVHPSYPPPWG